ncbi:MAG: LptF/LptG family permease [Bacteroidetes bacterium]|nr:LptF/LptG family permease [Bacteroidota bacterium]
MSKLIKLSFRHFTGPFIITFFIALFVLIMQFLWKYVDELAGKGLEWYIITELLFYASAHLVPLALPLAVLLSSIMTFGGLAENNELMAFKSSGVSLVRIMIPLLISMLFIGSGAFLFSNYTLPNANLKFGTLLYDVQEKKPSFDLKDGLFYNGIDQYNIRVGKKDKNGEDIYDVLIYDHTTGSENLIVIRAEKGKMKHNEAENSLSLTLFNGHRYEEIRSLKNANQTLPHSQLAFKEYRIVFDLSSFKFDRSDVQLFKGNYKMLKMNELSEKQDSISIEIADIKPKTKKYLQPYLYFLKDSSFVGVRKDSLDLNLDSMIMLLRLPDKENVYRRALANSRTAKHLVSSPASMISMLRLSNIGYEIEWHRKIILSIVILLLYLIGAPMGAIIRKGGFGMPTVVSIILFISFHIISMTGEKLAKQSIVDPWFGMWLPVMVLTPVALFLTIKANSDSRLFSNEGYERFRVWISNKLKINNDPINFS